jgi:hypothetical protein
VKYLILTETLNDGKYLTNSHPNWHEKMRIRLAKWILSTVPKRDSYEIKTTTGAS